MTNALLAAALAASVELTVEGTGPVRWGIPWPRGELKEARLRLTDDRGRHVPLGTKVLARWEDGSVKWSLIEFVRDAGAPGPTFTLADGAGREPPRVGVAESAKEVRLSNGRVELCIRKDAHELLSELGFDYDGDGSVAQKELVIRPRPHPGGRLVVVRADEMDMETDHLITRASPLGYSVHVERATALSATVVARGWYDARPRRLDPTDAAALFKTGAEADRSVRLSLADDGVRAVDVRTGKKTWEKHG